ncbi:MAG: MerR family DNA-binding transcriptional regulator [Pseudomonadales bacterium]
MPQSKTFSISDLAAEFDVTTRTIRFYEEKGLLAPTRNGSTRLYNIADRVKLKLILRGKRLGLTLEESRDIIDMYDPAHGNVKQLQKLIARFSDKRVQLEQQLQDLERMIMDLNDAENKCREALAKANPL